MSDPIARARSTTLMFYGCVLLLAYFLYELFEPFLTPLAWAAIFAAFFYSRNKRLEARLGRTTAAAISTAAVALIIVLPCVLLGIAFVQEVRQALGSVDLIASSAQGFDLLQGTWTWLQGQRFGRDIPDLDITLRQMAARLGAMVVDGAGELVRDILIVVANVIVMLFALFFLFRDGDAVMRALRRILPFDASFREDRIREAAELIHATVSSSVLVALAQGALGGLTFALLGLGGAVFWGVIMTFLSLLPMGAWIVWLPAAIWLLLTGETGRGIILLVVGAGGISMVDNILRPLLLSGRTQMNGLLVFISLLGGITAFGLIGLVLGPIVMATAISVIDAYATE